MQKLLAELIHSGWVGCNHEAGSLLRGPAIKSWGCIVAVCSSLTEPVASLCAYWPAWLCLLMMTACLLNSNAGLMARVCRQWN